MGNKRNPAPAPFGAFRAKDSIIGRAIRSPGKGTWRHYQCQVPRSPIDYLAGGSWVWVEPGALSGLPPGICAAPSVFGAAEFGAAPVVDGDAGITTVPLTGGAGRTAEGLPSIGDADCAYARVVAARIAAPVNSPNDIFCISCSS
jgi:hypothetical protein